MFITTGKGKGLPQQAEVAQGVPGRLRPRIFLTFGTTRLVGRQPHAPAAFTPRRGHWYSFLEAESTPGHVVPSVATKKIPSVTPPGIDHETVRLVAQCLTLPQAPHYNRTPAIYTGFLLVWSALSAPRPLASEVLKVPTLHRG
jgi:hypothetical protein